MKIRILFIIATDTPKKMLHHYPPLGVAYLISTLRNRFSEHDIDFKLVSSDIEKVIIEFKPDIVCISSVTATYNFAKEYAKIAKKYSLPVIVGGYHISTMPNSLTEDMDVGVIGEGETTICELIDLFMQTASFDKGELEKINGIIYRDDSGNIKMTKKRELINPLDKIPLPARDVLEIGDDTYMFTSRGCPYNCVFCSSSRFWNGIRYFSAEYVFNEIKYLIETYKIRHIHFYDDLFIANKERIRTIFDLLEKNGYWGKVTFSCQARANLIDEEMAQLLKKMGFKAVGVGFETGCEETLRYLKGESVTIGDNKRAIELIKKYGMVAQGSFIIGAPKESREDILKTLEFIKKSKLDEIFMCLLTPLPGTPLWEYAESRGLVSSDMDWSKLKIKFTDDMENSIILSETLSREELTQLFKMFLNEERKRKILYIIKSGLCHPLRAPRFLKLEMLEFLKNKDN